jgi:hypothetical protein
MAEAQLVSLPGRGVVSGAPVCGASRGRRDRAASRCRAAAGGRGAGALLWPAAMLGRRVARLDVASAGEALIGNSAR